jgi:TonB family protein
MIAAWILHTLLVSLLVGVGALVLETLLRGHRRPTRWVWAGAMLLSVAWPLGKLLLERLPTRELAAPVREGAPMVFLDPLVVQVGPESVLRILDGPILLSWALAAVILLLVFSLVLIRTHRLRRGWHPEVVRGHSVLFSRDWGPGVVGFLRPAVVLPEWCRGLDDQSLRLILDHETEHLRAGDLRLILAARILPILVPWNLPLWWQLSRLRMAVEGDCDLRVLGKHQGRARPYLELLLDVGRGVPGPRALAAMLSEPKDTLERRIRIMTMPFPKNPWIRALILGSVGALLIAIACWAPGPLGLDDTAAPRTFEDSPAAELPPPPLGAAATDPSGAPTFTPFTVRPDIKNRSELVQALEREYPRLLRDAGIGGTAQVWFYIDETGRVANLLINQSSGHEALDEAALRVAEVIQFTPALNRDQPVPVWISLPVTFTTGTPGAAAVRTPAGTDEAELRARRIQAQMEERLRDDPPRPAVPVLPSSEAAQTEARVQAPVDPAAGPTFTPFTVRPDIKNRSELVQALEREYPRLLRDAGIGGTAQVWFYIDETGRVANLLINQSSGHEALDEAALRVAEVIQFTPALNRDQPVPVWISLPVTFTTR